MKLLTPCRGMPYRKENTPAETRINSQNQLRSRLQRVTQFTSADVTWLREPSVKKSRGSFARLTEPSYGLRIRFLHCKAPPRANFIPVFPGKFQSSRPANPPEMVDNSSQFAELCTVRFSETPCFPVPNGGSTEQNRRLKERRCKSPALASKSPASKPAMRSAPLVLVHRHHLRLLIFVDRLLVLVDDIVWRAIAAVDVRACPAMSSGAAHAIRHGRRVVVARAARPAAGKGACSQSEQ